MNTTGKTLAALSVGMLNLVMCLNGCAEERRPIPTGTYVSASKEESVSVVDRKIRFHVKVGDDGPSGFLDGTFNYSVWPDGTIMPHGMTSVEAGGLVGRFEWRWDGENITQRDMKSQGPPKTFRRSVVARHE